MKKKMDKVDKATDPKGIDAGMFDDKPLPKAPKRPKQPKPEPKKKEPQTKKEEPKKAEFSKSVKP